MVSHDEAIAVLVVLGASQGPNTPLMMVGVSRPTGPATHQPTPAQRYPACGPSFFTKFLYQPTQKIADRAER
jgi:hypothetical protein